MIIAFESLIVTQFDYLMLGAIGTFIPRIQGCARLVHFGDHVSSFGLNEGCNATVVDGLLLVYPMVAGLLHGCHPLVACRLAQSS